MAAEIRDEGGTEQNTISCRTGLFRHSRVGKTDLLNSDMCVIGGYGIRGHNKLIPESVGDSGNCVVNDRNCRSDLQMDETWEVRNNQPLFARVEPVVTNGRLSQQKAENI
jgi:hypothetical protein